MDLFGKDSSTKTGTPADKHKQTIIVIASVGGVIVAYLAYKHMSTGGAGSASTGAPQQIGVEGPGTTLDDQGILTRLDSMTGLLTDLAHRAPVIGPAGPAGPAGPKGTPGVPDVKLDDRKEPTPTTPAKATPATPTAHPAMQAAPKQAWYTVRKGDTLSGISKRIGLGGNWGALKGANQQTITKTAEQHGHSEKSAASGHWIFPGEKLLIPQGAHPPTHG